MVSLLHILSVFTCSLLVFVLPLLEFLYRFLNKMQKYAFYCLRDVFLFILQTLLTLKFMRAYKILIFILSVFILLAVVCIVFPKDGISIGGHQFRFPTLEDVLTSKEEMIDAQERIKQMEEELTKMRQDSMAFADSLSYYTNFFTAHDARIHLPNNDFHFLDDFFTSLEESTEKGEVVHILHYGDSQIEADRITAYIREQLQQQFGGNGPGLLPAVQPIPTISVGQTCSSESLSRYIITGTLMQKTDHNRYGVLGQVAELKGGNVTLSVSARNWKDTFDGVKQFSKIRLFVGQNKDNFSATLSTSGGYKNTKTIANEKAGLTVLTWDLANPVGQFSLALSGTAEIYGMAADGDHGVAVDNIPLRGSSGIFFRKMDSALMKAMLKELNVKLIILEFGGNAMPVISSEKKVETYKNEFSNQVAHLNAIYPEAKILVIGPSDMSKKINGKLQTRPYLENVVDAMRDASLENGAAFWDMYRVMGGHNSMISWVSNKPAWAASDYVHFTVKGAEKIATMFVESLMLYYDHYVFVNHKQRKNVKQTLEEEQKAAEAAALAEQQKDSIQQQTNN
jgi:lysophospholipase L1-like esterase